MNELNDIWESEPDNDFTRRIFKRVDWVVPLSSLQTRLCYACMTMDTWSGGFKINKDLVDLKKTSKACDLCRMLYQALLERLMVDMPKVEFLRTKSEFRIDPNGPLVLSIYADPGMSKALQSSRFSSKCTQIARFAHHTHSLDFRSYRLTEVRYSWRFWKNGYTSAMRRTIVYQNRQSKAIPSCLRGGSMLAPTWTQNCIFLKEPP